MDRNFPYFTHLEIFRCTTYVLILKESKHKLEFHSNECIFLGYNEQSKAYKLQVKFTKLIIICKDVTFNETSIFALKGYIVEMVNQTNELLLNQTFLKSFTWPPHSTSSSFVPNALFQNQSIMSSITRSTPNIIETNKNAHMKTCTQIHKCCVLLLWTLIPIICKCVFLKHEIETP